MFVRILLIGTEINMAGRSIGPAVQVRQLAPRHVSDIILHHAESLRLCHICPLLLNQLILLLNQLILTQLVPAPTWLWLVRFRLPLQLFLDPASRRFQRSTMLQGLLLAQLVQLQQDQLVELLQRKARANQLPHYHILVVERCIDQGTRV